ncbi:MAG TPA: acyl-CoA thioesterase, partial [Spirochaetia bacterium]|nr:acyl-CoA thioesterase [Spirochaetia bacterium]
MRGRPMAEAGHNAEEPFEVRDYECDLQGVVNNAVYLHYLEHARHRWLEAIGVDFAALHQQGMDLVVARIEVDYRSPLRSRDRFVVRSRIQREGRLKLIFQQEIFRVPDEKLVIQARVVTAALQNGRPVVAQAVLDRLEGTSAGTGDAPPGS